MRFIPRFSITNAIAAALTEIERARGFLDAASLSDEWIDSMRSRAFLLEAHHTTHYRLRRPGMPDRRLVQMDSKHTSLSCLSLVSDIYLTLIMDTVW